MDRKSDRQTQVEISTIHRSRERLGRVDSGQTTVQKREDVKNSVLPRWRSAAIKADERPLTNDLNLIVVSFIPKWRTSSIQINNCKRRSLTCDKNYYYTFCLQIQTFIVTEEGINS